MNNKSKKIASSVGIFALVAALVLPVAVLAKSRTISAQTNFCAALPALATTIQSRASNRLKNIQTREQNVIAQVSISRSQDDLKNQTARESWNTERQAQFDKLAQIANTKSKSQVLQSFVNSVDTAENSRDTAANAAVQAYRSGVDQLLSTRQATIQQAFVTYQNSIYQSVQQAQTQCSAGTSPSGVAQNFSQAAASELNTYTQTLHNIPKLKIQEQPLADIRDAAVAAATSSFNATVKQSGAQLKSALGQ